MSLRAKKILDQKTKVLSDNLVKKKKATEGGNENQSSNKRLQRKNISKKLPEGQNTEAKPEEPDNSLSSTVKPELKFSCLGFWSKKLEDLEKSKKKNKKSEYDFSCTEESDSSYKIKKPKRKKEQIQRKGQSTEPKYKKPIKNMQKLLKPEKSIHTQALIRKETVISRERKKLADNHKSFKCPTGLQSVAFTSTPAVNGTNLFDPSTNFVFLSPIIKEKSKYSNGVNENSTTTLNCNDGKKTIKIFDQETPKVQTRLRKISCRRVLRSGKMLTK